MANLARQQVLDKIYMKHGVRYADFNRALKEYDFEGDEDFPAGDVVNSTRSKWNNNYLGFGHSFR